MSPTLLYILYVLGGGGGGGGFNTFTSLYLFQFSK